MVEASRGQRIDPAFSVITPDHFLAERIVKRPHHLLFDCSYDPVQRCFFGYLSPAAFAVSTATSCPRNS